MGAYTVIRELVQGVLPARQPRLPQDFSAAYPLYETTVVLDALRAKDFNEFGRAGEIYLDYTGGGLYGRSQIKAHMSFLGQAVYGNPHSDSPTSRRSTQHVETARAAVLDFFHASPDEYDVIFTPNASGALKLVAEAYPFQKGGRFLQLLDNHNSVNGIREYARQKGAAIGIIPTYRPDLRARKAEITAALTRHGKAPHLFAYPAQSNFSGVQHPLAWIEQAHAEGWDVVLDAAAFAPTNQLNLSRWQPDFVPISFYKIFGWPTGIGCLIARKQALAKLQRPWFAGGTIWAVSVLGDWHVLAPAHEAFEDGTVNYLNLPAVTTGLQYIEHVGVETIHTRVMCLTGWLLSELSALRHPNGRSAVRLYGPKTIKNRGATIAFNFLDQHGKVVDERIVERRANAWHISLRTGCFCNPGSGEVAFHLPTEKLITSFGNGKQVRYDTYLRDLGLASAGAIRISLGLVSNFSDVQTFLRFATTFVGDPLDEPGLRERSHC